MTVLPEKVVIIPRGQSNVVRPLDFTVIKVEVRSKKKEGRRLGRNL